MARPRAARAQQRERMRRIGVFMPGVADDPENEAQNAAFLQGLGELGWIVGRNVRIDYRWGAVDIERFHAIAAELIALSRRMSSWPSASRPSARCKRRPAACRSCSRVPPIRSAAA